MNYSVASNHNDECTPGVVLILTCNPCDAVKLLGTSRSFFSNFFALSFCGNPHMCAGRQAERLS